MLKSRTEIFPSADHSLASPTKWGFMHFMRFAPRGYDRPRRGGARQAVILQKARTLVSFRPSNEVHRRGFTLIELLVTISIIGILIGMLLPAVMYARASMRATHCKANLHQIAIAMTTYVDRQGVFGVFPDAAILPTLTPNRPTIVTVLKDDIESSKSAFICPSDIEFADKEGLSYEYPATRLAGKRRVELTANRNGEDVYASSEVLLMYDYENFHGIWKSGTQLDYDDETTYLRGSRNFLYLDGHVDNF